MALGTSMKRARKWACSAHQGVGGQWGTLAPVFPLCLFSCSPQQGLLAAPATASPSPAVPPPLPPPCPTAHRYVPPQDGSWGCWGQAGAACAGGRSCARAVGGLWGGSHRQRDRLWVCVGCCHGTVWVTAGAQGVSSEPCVRGVVPPGRCVAGQQPGSAGLHHCPAFGNIAAVGGSAPLAAGSLRHSSRGCSIPGRARTPQCQGPPCCPGCPQPIPTSMQ